MPDIEQEEDPEVAAFLKEFKEKLWATIERELALPRGSFTESQREIIDARVRVELGYGDDA